MSQWDISLKAKLLEAESYRDFLRCFFSKGTWQRPRPLSFQEFANNSGLASKGSLADVIAGRKRLTPNSLPKVIVGLKLNREWANYLHFLVLELKNDANKNSHSILLDVDASVLFKCN